MNILRLSTLSLTLAIAVFALGYNPSFADNPNKGNHPHGDGGDKTETEFMVEMQRGKFAEDTAGLVTSDGKACGITKGEINDGVLFPDGCVTVKDVFFITGPTGGPLTLKLFTIGVKVNRSSAHLFFTDGPILFPLRNPGDGYGITVPVKIIPDADGSSFTVEVNMDGLAVEKSHQPRKREFVGPIVIGEIVYTPID